MNYIIYSLIAFIAGGAIAIQAGMNSRLGVLLKSSFLAATVVYVGNFLFTVLYIVISSGSIPDSKSLKVVPVYLWFSGSILSAFAISSMYWLIPRAGVGPMMSFYLAGQLLFSIIAGHFGWFHLPVTQITTMKLAGISLLLASIVLINHG